MKVLQKSYLCHSKNPTRTATRRTATRLPASIYGHVGSSSATTKKYKCNCYGAKQVYNFVTREVASRVISRVSFRFGHKSFYWFGICSCLATNHKQTLKDAIQHEIIVHFGFPGNITGWPPIVYCTLANRLANHVVSR